MRKTGVWPNIVTRRKDGDLQLAYGHHRVEAASQEFGKDHEITVIVEPLDEPAMIRMMCLENQQEFHSDFVATMEAVAAVVKGYAAGDIKLGAIDEKTKINKPIIRYAPSFIAGGNGDADGQAHLHPYTAQEIAEWLGWVVKKKDEVGASDKVKDALSALELIELAEMQPSDLRGLTVRQVHETIRTAQRQRHEKLSQARYAEREAAKAEAQAKHQRKEAQRAEREAKTAKKPAKRRHAEYERAKAEAEAQRLDEQAADWRPKSRAKSWKSGKSWASACFCCLPAMRQRLISSATR